MRYLFGKGVLIVAVVLFIVSGCSPKFSQGRTSGIRFDTIKRERPRTVLIMPPIGHMLDQRGKAFVSSIVAMALAEKGYYVLSPSSVDKIMDGLDKDDPEWYVENSARRLYAQYGADAIVLVRVNGWSASVIGVTRSFDVSCLMKSTHSGDILFENRIYNSESAGVMPDEGIAEYLIWNSIYLLLTSKRTVAKDGVNILFRPLPDGPYAPKYSLY
ncbi:GNA1162 family protein [Porphyromonas sp.]|uniref:GNA1162 family protein n=1 Tax=Porphyromonas sp. TaxID=1924944 RepID=UPI0026DAD95A|nr:GNA1162 family protein [Porphyromonas sp.]MDO4695205.1 DUF799 family lipoprotein [Porphyromonas sp.]MDO4770995.1 DUF799 family lipoprotein [Porphyromonas sp.]